MQQMSGKCDANAHMERARTCEQRARADNSKMHWNQIKWNVLVCAISFSLLTWYSEQLKQCQQQLSPSTYFFAWPFSHSKLHTDSGGFGWCDLNCTSAIFQANEFSSCVHWMLGIILCVSGVSYVLCYHPFRSVHHWLATDFFLSVVRSFVRFSFSIEWGFK